MNGRIMKGKGFLKVKGRVFEGGWRRFEGGWRRFEDGWRRFEEDGGGLKRMEEV